MKYYVLIIFLFAGFPLAAQKTVTEDEQAWFGLFSQLRFTDRWGAWAETQFRLRDDFIKASSTAIARFGLTHYLGNDVRLTAGYAYVHHYPGGANRIGQPEHRPWQQIQWFQRGKWARLMQWVRLEERFRRKILDGTTLGDGYDFNYRARYNLALFLPLTAKGFAPGGLQLLLNDEAMLNFGDEIVHNTFDQNRLFAGLVYQVNPHAQLHAGYMNVFQQLPAGDAYRSIHAIRISYFHNFDFRTLSQQPETRHR
jgi:hypothetical protein